MRLGIVSDGQQPGGRAGSGQVSGEMRLRFKGGVLRVQLSGSAWGSWGVSRVSHFRGGLSNFFRQIIWPTSQHLNEGVHMARINLSRAVERAHLDYVTRSSSLRTPFHLMPGH